MRPEEPVAARRSAPPDDPSLIDIAELALALGTDLERGLGAEEAAQRLQADGPNELRAVAPVPAWRRALAQLQDPLVYLLGAAAAVALAAWWFEGRGQPGAAGWPLDAIVIAFVVVLNAVLGWLQEAKAAQAVAALAKMTTATSAVLRDGAVARVPSAELVKGDRAGAGRRRRRGRRCAPGAGRRVEAAGGAADRRERAGAEGRGAAARGLRHWATG